jgi:hypothetical protein
LTMTVVIPARSTVSAPADGASDIGASMTALST